jgi:hypothetical protein
MRKLDLVSKQSIEGVADELQKDISCFKLV